MEPEIKLKLLKEHLEGLGSLAVAFSGGVDSTFLLKVAQEVLGERAAGITAFLPVHAEWEMEEAATFAESIGVRYYTIKGDMTDLQSFAHNPPERCYLCKTKVFTQILRIAGENGFQWVADGSNVDDMGDYRPGMKALKELNIISPLREAGMTKADIRILSKEMGLPTWNKPAFACLASRIPYGNPITEEKLRMIEKAERYLMDLGFRQVRVRHHGDVARIEVETSERERFLDPVLMERIQDKFEEIGFPYAALDLKGYRMGSLNKQLEKIKYKVNEL